MPDKNIPKDMTEAVNHGFRLFVRDLLHKGLFWVILAIVVIGSVVGGWMWFKGSVAEMKEAATPCFATPEKDCGRWAHPRQWGWFGGGKEEKGPPQSTPASQTATAPQSTPVEEPVDTRPCANDWILGSCYWEKRVSAEE